MQAIVARYAFPALAGLLLAGLIVLALVAGARHQFSAGLEAGRAEVRAEAEAARATAAEAALGRLEARLQASNAAVDAYLASVQTRASRALRGEIDRYASATAGLGPCLDADGLRLLDAARSANRPRGDTSGPGGARPPLRPSSGPGG